MTSTDSFVKFLEAGFDEVLRKPVTKAKIDSLLHREGKRVD